MIVNDYCIYLIPTLYGYATNGQMYMYTHTCGWIYEGNDYGNGGGDATTTTRLLSGVSTATTAVSVADIMVGWSCDLLTEDVFVNTTDYSLRSHGLWVFLLCLRQLLEQVGIFNAF